MGEETTYEVSLPTVEVTEEVMRKIELLAEFEHEVGAWLTGEAKDGTLKVDGVLIPEQEASKADVEIKPEHTVKLLKEFGSDVCNRVVGHLHTHNTMGAFWSSTDEENMSQLTRPRQFFFFIVTSYDNGVVSYKARLAVNQPFKFYVDGVKIKVSDGELKRKLRDALKEEVTKKVKLPALVNYYPTTLNGYGSSGYGFNRTPVEKLDYLFGMPMITRKAKHGEYEVYVDGIEQDDLEGVREVVDAITVEVLGKADYSEELRKDGKVKITVKCKDKPQTKSLWKAVKESLSCYYEELYADAVAEKDADLKKWNGGGDDYGRGEWPSGYIG